ncbi:MAG: drug resistance transporter, EmrB/QacA subfamily [Cyanobacteria bacterium RYN_339]|nr:drug resistance transporter, EmrB/QacA subfamily [Cyanobacteria bacterium RYN_339]
MTTLAHQPTGRKNPLAHLVTDENYMWWATIPVILGMFIVIMDNSIVNVALPHIMSDFGSNLEEIEWVSTGYMLASAVMMPTTGYLGDRFGRKRVYWIATAMFTLASVLCGMAWNTPSLIIFRVFQGIVGGAIQPVSQAIIFEAFPPAKRGMSMAVVGIGAMFAPMLGPTVGGYLVDYISWRWIFYVNLPFGILAVFMTLFIIRESATRKLPFDAWGLTFMATFLTTVLLAVSQGNKEGWDSPYIVALMATGLISFGLFVIVEMWRAHPLIDLRLFEIGTYTAGTCSSIVMGVGLFGGMFLLPLFLQNEMDYDAIQTGLLMLPQGLAVAFTMPVAAKLMARTDPRYLMVGGMGLIGLTLWLQGSMTPETSSFTLVWWTVLRGIGMGLAFPSMNQTTLASVPITSVGMASGMFNVTRQIGGSFSIALLTTLITQRNVFHTSILGQDAARTGMAHEFTAQVQQHALTMGNTAMEAHAVAGASMAGLIAKQASVLAFQDAFYAAGVVMFLGIIPCLFVKKKAQEGPADSSHAMVME